MNRTVGFIRLIMRIYVQCCGYCLLYQCLKLLVPSPYSGRDHIMSLLTCVRYRDHIALIMPYFKHDRFTVSRPCTLSTYCTYLWVFCFGWHCRLLRLCLYTAQKLSVLGQALHACTFKLLWAHFLLFKIGRQTCMVVAVYNFQYNSPSFLRMNKTTYVRYMYCYITFLLSEIKLKSVDFIVHTYMYIHNYKQLCKLYIIAYM